MSLLYIFLPAAALAALVERPRRTCPKGYRKRPVIW